MAELSAREEAARVVAELEEEVREQLDQVAFWTQKEKEARQQEDALAAAFFSLEKAQPTTSPEALTLEQAEPEPQQERRPHYDKSPGSSSSPATRGLSFGRWLTARDESASSVSPSGSVTERRRRAQPVYEHQQLALVALGLTSRGEPVHAVPHKPLDARALRALAGVWQAHGHARDYTGEMAAVDEAITLRVDGDGGVSSDGSEAPEIDRSIVVVRSHATCPFVTAA